MTQEAAISEWVALIESKTKITTSIKLFLKEKKGIQLKIEGITDKNGENPHQGNDQNKINKFLENYANANFQKLNNMIAQAPQNHTNDSNNMVYQNILELYAFFRFHSLI